MAENGVLWLIMAENRRNGAYGMSYLCIENQKSVLEHHSTSARPALDQRKRIRRGSLENLEHTSSKLATDPQLVNKIINSLTHSTIMGTTYKK